jgi:hypothetical protein
MAEEQRELANKVNKLTPLIRIFGGASSALILVHGAVSGPAVRG